MDGPVEGQDKHAWGLSTAFAGAVAFHKLRASLTKLGFLLEHLDTTVPLGAAQLPESWNLTR